MNHELLSVDVVQALDQLLKEVLCVVFLELSALANVTEEVATLAELHDEANVLLGFEGVVEANDVVVVALLQDGDLLHDLLLLLGLTLQNLLLDRLDSDQVFAHLMARQVHFTEGSLSENSAHPIELVGARLHLAELSEVQAHHALHLLDIGVVLLELLLLRGDRLFRLAEGTFVHF
uniref:Uncharacterized protein n=1 Tax=Strombidium inclinatum TaxID=197538 RepID=A0A7S3ITU3_9SPIT